MGFDLFIGIKFNMCPHTGKPYYYGKDVQKMYDISEIVVPTEFRDYLQLRGHFLHAYTRDFNQENRFEVEVGEFLDGFPKWTEVKSDPMYDDYWTKQNHLTFKSLLKWCQEQQCIFNVSWSY